MSSSIDDIADDRTGAAESEAITWNLFSQILVPMVLILSVIAVLQKERWEVVNRTIELSNGMLMEVLNSADDDSQIGKSRQLENAKIDRQYFALLAALERVMAQERVRLALDTFSEGRAIKVSGTTIDDERFQRTCVEFHEGIAGRSGRRINQSYLRSIYDRVLVAAELRDEDAEIAALVDRISRRSQNHQEALYETVKDDRIVAANRIRILEQIVIRATDMTTVMGSVQASVLERIYKGLLAAPELIEPEEKVLIARLLQADVSSQEREAIGKALHERLSDRLRRTLDDRGYRFLDRTWTAVRHL